MIFVYLVLFFFIRHIMLIFQFICAHLWCPSVKMPTLGIPDYNLDISQFSHDISRYYTGDGAKFIGQAYSCLQTEEVWEQVKKFWDFDKKEFFRVEEPDTSFSGDMMAGMVLAIATRHRQGKLTVEEKKFLSDLVWKLAFKNLVPFKFKHSDMSRGYFWTPWAPAMNCAFQALLLLKWGFLFETNIVKKLLMGLAYALLFIPNILLFIFGMYDHNVYVKKVYACWWYGTHSDALTYAAAALEKITFGRYGLHLLNKRYGQMNADIAALAHAFNGESQNHEIVYSLVSDLVRSRDGSTFVHNKQLYYSVRDIPSNLKKWFTALVAVFKGKNKLSAIWTQLKAFKSAFNCWKEREDTFNGGFQCQDRTWERNQQERGKAHSNLGDLDIIFPLAVVDGCFDFDFE